MKIALIIIVFAVCGAVFLGPSGSISQRNLSYPKESQDALHSYLEGGKRILYSSAGVITETLSVDKATKFIDQPDTLMTGIQYQSKGDEESEWDVQATTGVYKELNGELVLRNGVTIIERNSNVHMRTTSMNLFLNEKKVTSDSPVTLIGQGSQTSSNGFELDLHKNIATLIGNVKTEYE